MIKEPIKLGPSAHLRMNGSKLFLTIKNSQFIILNLLVFLSLFILMIYGLYMQDEYNFSQGIIYLIYSLGFIFLLNTSDYFFKFGAKNLYCLDVVARTMKKEVFFMKYLISSKEYKWMEPFTFIRRDKTGSEDGLLWIWISVTEFDTLKEQKLIKFYNYESVVNFIKILKEHYPEVRIIE